MDAKELIGKLQERVEDHIEQAAETTDAFKAKVAEPDYLTIREAIRWNGLGAMRAEMLASELTKLNKYLVEQDDISTVTDVLEQEAERLQSSINRYNPTNQSTCVFSLAVTGAEFEAQVQELEIIKRLLRMIQKETN